MSDKESNKTNERIQSMITSGSRERNIGTDGGVVQRSVTDVDAHLSADAEEARYEIVCFEDSLRMHLSDEVGEGLGAVLSATLGVK